MKLHLSSLKLHLKLASASGTDERIGSLKQNQNPLLLINCLWPNKMLGEFVITLTSTRSLIIHGESLVLPLSGGHCEYAFWE